MASIFSTSPSHPYAWSGLRILSQLPLPDLIPAPRLGPSNADIRIEGRYALAGRELDGFSAESWLETKSDQVEFHIHELVTVSVRADRIHLLVHPEARMRSVQAVACGTALSCLAQIRKMLALHASAVATPRGAALFVGPRKSGKTSLAACMSCLGAPIIADDPAIIWLEGERVLTAPSLACARPTATELAAFMPLGVSPPRAVPCATGFDRRRVSHIFILSSPEQDIPRLGPADAIAGLARNLYRPTIVERMGRRPFAFQRAAKIVDRVHVEQLHLPSDLADFPALAKDLLNRIANAPVQREDETTNYFRAISRAS